MHNKVIFAAAGQSSPIGFITYLFKILSPLQMWKRTTIITLQSREARENWPYASTPKHISMGADELKSKYKNASPSQFFGIEWFYGVN